MADAKAPYVQPQAYYPDGTPIPAEEFGKAVAEGTARFEEGARVYVRNQEGKLQTVDASDIHHAGVTVAHPDDVAQAWERKEYGKGIGNEAKALAAGAARGLTLGASDYVASKVGGDETRHSLDALRRQNPWASGAGEVIGAAAPVVLSGGAAAPEEAGLLAAGRGAEALSSGAEVASLASRGAGLAGSAVRAAGVAPRAVAAAGSLVERGVARGLESLGYEGTSLAGRVAAGAVKTGASGAVEGAIYGGAQAADDSVLKGDDVTAEKIVAGMGDGALFGGALGAGIGAASPLLGAAARKVLPDKEALEEFSRDRALKAVGRDTESFGKNLPAPERAALRQSIAEDLQYVIKTGELEGKPLIAAGDNTEAILEKLSQAKRETGAALGGVKEQVNDLMVQRPELAPDMGELLGRIKAEVIDPLNASKSAGSRSQARAVERELKILTAEHEARVASAVNDNSGELSAPPSPTFLELDKYRQTVADRLSPKGSSRAVAAATNKNLEPLEKMNRVIGDYLKDKAEQALTASGEDAGQYRELSRQYFSFTGLQKAADKAAAANARNRSFSASDHGMGMMGFLGSLVTGNVGALGGMVVGGAVSAANKLIRARGNSTLSVMAKRAADMDLHVDAVARSLAGHADAAKAVVQSTASTVRNLSQEYERTAARVRELSRPEVALQHTSSMFPEVHAQYPQVGTAVSSKLMQVIQHLNQALPPPDVSTGDTLTPLAVKDRVNPVAMSKWMSQVRGALRPGEVMRELARGQLDRDAVDSMRAMYPQTFLQLQNRAMQYIGEREETLPYRQKAFLSSAFSIVGDSSFEPARLASLQQVIASPSASNGDSGAKPKTARPRPSRLGKSFATPADSALET